jgi:hypothetical protein
LSKKTKEVDIQGEQFRLTAAPATRVLELFTLATSDSTNRPAALRIEDTRFLNRELLNLCARVHVVDGNVIGTAIPDLWAASCTDPLASEPGKLALLLKQAFEFGVSDPLAAGLPEKSES